MEETPSLAAAQGKKDSLALLAERRVGPGSLQSPWLYLVKLETGLHVTPHFLVEAFQKPSRMSRRDVGKDIHGTLFVKKKKEREREKLKRNFGHELEAHLQGAGSAKSGSTLGWMPCSGDLVWPAQSLVRGKTGRIFKHKTEPYIVCENKDMKQKYRDRNGIKSSGRYHNKIWKRASQAMFLDGKTQYHKNVNSPIFLAQI